MISKWGTMEEQSFESVKFQRNRHINRYISKTLLCFIHTLGFYAIETEYRKTLLDLGISNITISLVLKYLNKVSRLALIQNYKLLRNL